MQKVKLLVDFQGRETNELLLPAGSIQELDETLVAWLIEHHKAERVLVGRITVPSQSKVTKKSGRK